MTSLRLAAVARLRPGKDLEIGIWRRPLPAFVGCLVKGSRALLASNSPRDQQVKGASKTPGCPRHSCPGSFFRFPPFARPLLYLEKRIAIDGKHTVGNHTSVPEAVVAAGAAELVRLLPLDHVPDGRRIGWPFACTSFTT